MAKLKAAEMTKEQLNERHAKAKQRRATRRDAYKKGALDIIDKLGDNYEQLSDEAKHLLTVLTGEYRPVQKVQCVAGDKLMDLLQRYATVKNVYAKLMKWCDEHQLKLDVKTATIVKA